MKPIVLVCVLAMCAGALADIGLDLQNSNGYNYEPPPNPMYLPPEDIRKIDVVECPPPPAPKPCPPPPPPVVCPTPPPPPPPCPVCPPPPPPVVCPKPPPPPPAPKCDCEAPRNTYLPPDNEYLPPGKRFRKL